MQHERDAQFFGEADFDAAIAAAQCADLADPGMRELMHHLHDVFVPGSDRQLLSALP